MGHCTSYLNFLILNFLSSANINTNANISIRDSNSTYTTGLLRELNEQVIHLSVF